MNGFIPDAPFSGNGAAKIKNPPRMKRINGTSHMMKEKAAAFQGRLFLFIQGFQ